MPKSSFKSKIGASKEEIAEWMFEEVRRKGKLYQWRAARYIHSAFDPKHVYTTKGGGLRIKSYILDAFKALTEEEVIWTGKYWKLREPFDVPGKRRTQWRTGPPPPPGLIN